MAVGNDGCKGVRVWEVMVVRVWEVMVIRM